MPLITSLGNWMHRKKYQFEVTFCVYIFTPWEKFIFCTSGHCPSPPSPAINHSPYSTSKRMSPRRHANTPRPTDTLLFLLVGLTFIATALYLPQHIAFIVGRAWFYMHGDNVDMVELTKEVVDSALAHAPGFTSTATEAAETLVKEL
jgi:hypothetical protein